MLSSVKKLFSSSSTIDRESPAYTSEMSANPPQPPTNAGYFTKQQTFSNTGMVIFMLILLLIISFLGINIFIIIGTYLQMLGNLFNTLFVRILSAIGYTTGTVLEESADAVANLAKTGIDIADGTLHSVGDILKNQSPKKEGFTSKQLTNDIKATTYNVILPEPDESSSTIQTPNSTMSWCATNKNNNKCTEVADASKCQSGQLFPSQLKCLMSNLENE